MYASPHNYPPGYGFDNRTPPVSPANAHYYPHPPPPRYTYQSAQTPSPRGPSKAQHARRASHQVPSGYSFSARVPPPQHPDPRFASHYQSSPLRTPEYVSSGFDYVRGQTRSRAPEGMRSGKQSYDDPRYHSYWQYMYELAVDADYDFYDAPPPYEARSKFARAHHFYHQERDRAPQPEPATPKANQARARRASTANPTRPHASPPKSKPSPTKSRKATEEDARIAGIPAGYSIKNWDPTEEPITLLGSVFDANSLGKWVYDWTVFAYGPATPMSDVAGDLWLLLIQLAGKVKRADEAIEKIRQEENRELVEDFLESGERLWVRVKKLLKTCEEYMWKAAQRETGEKKPIAMGKNSGVEFVDSIFGRDRELDKTEKLMSNIRLWSMRFDANCDDILRNPTT